MIRLLVITNNDSLEQPSFRQRIAIYLDLLRSKGIDCQVARLPRGKLERRALFACAPQFEGVLLHRKILNAWDAFWLRRLAGTVIYDFDDAVMYSNREDGRICRIRARRFRRAVALSSLVLAGNEYLAQHARQYNAHVEILPTGLDVGAYPVATPQEKDGLIRLVWIGSGSVLKHLRRIVPALEELGRRFPQVRLRIISNEFLDLRRMPVEQRPWSRRTEVADLVASDIGLAPLTDDPFTRGKCAFKILQYQAAGLPVVASPVGVNEQYVRDGGTGFLVRDPSQWVNRIAALIESPDLRLALGRAGRQDVERFDVHVVGARLCDLILGCLGQGKREHPAPWNLVSK
ncbi:MAG: glycosyltransferase family 4 protein [Planctomycetes bacterium]|nr:glycosyltransferase family 4 protein [Planctomycetota bacterium]